MSGYQEEKNLQKRHQSYGDYNPHWDYLNTRDEQSAGNRRGAISYNTPSQGHMGWNQMQMQQTNPYYGSHHMMPAHAHSGSDYGRYNQWNNTKSGHTPRSIHQHTGGAGVTNKLQEYNIGLPQEFTKLRNNPHDFVHRTAPDFQSSRHPPPPLHASPLSLPKPALGNPLSDLQLLVTNQDKNENLTQHESVDLSAHSDVVKSNDRDELVDVSVIQTQCKQVTVEKPVELIAKIDNNVNNTEKTEELKEEKNEPPEQEQERIELQDDKPSEEDVNKKEKAVENEPVDIKEESTQAKKESEENITPVESNDTSNVEEVVAETSIKEVTEAPVETKQEEEMKTVVESVENFEKSTLEAIEKPQVIKKVTRKRPARPSRRSSGNSTSSEPWSSKKKKNVVHKTKESQNKKLSEALRRGPVVRIEGTRDNPGTCTVINILKLEDGDEDSKRSVQTSSKKKMNETNYRGRVRNGLFSSTLSSRYDAQSTDHTWICVFCKRGPHYHNTGDLFGPYIITKPGNNDDSALCDYSGDEKDITDAQKRGGRNKRSLRANNMVEHFQKMSKKLKRTQSSDAGVYSHGMTLLTGKTDELLRFEVWVHEQCAVWAAGVYFIRNRLVGLEEAIWAAVRTMCSRCGEMGGNLGCVRRNCANRAHHVCAQESGWYLNNETLVATCQVHRSRT